MPSVSYTVLRLGNFLLRYWNPFEFVLAMTFTKHLRFYVEGRKDYLHGTNDRNVADPVFSRLIGPPRFPTALDVLPGSRFTIPKASVATEFSKASLRTHQHATDHQISTDVPSVNIILHFLEKYFHVIRGFLQVYRLSNRNGSFGISVMEKNSFRTSL